MSLEVNIKKRLGSFTLDVSFSAGDGALALLGSGGALQWLAAAGFAVCYLLGCALSVLAVGRVNLMNLLSERE